MNKNLFFAVLPWIILLLVAILSGCDSGLKIHPAHYEPADKVCGKGRYEDITVFADYTRITCKSGSIYIVK